MRNTTPPPPGDRPDILPLHAEGPSPLTGLAALLLALADRRRQHAQAEKPVDAAAAE